MSMTKSGPHAFERLNRLRGREKCRHCHLPRIWHPVQGWVDARPIGNRS